LIDLPAELVTAVALNLAPRFLLIRVSGLSGLSVNLHQFGLMRNETRQMVDKVVGGSVLSHCRSVESILPS